MIEQNFIDEFQKILLLDELDNELFEIQQNILFGLSYFIDENELVNLIRNNISKIDLYNLSANSNQRLNHIIGQIYVSNISEKDKLQIMAGLGKSEKFNIMYDLLISYDNMTIEDRAIIFDQFILSTTNPHFVAWLDAHSLAVCVSQEILSEVNSWIKEYGWMKKDLKNSQLENRFILVYFLLRKKDLNAEILCHISNRLKFVGTLIYNDKKKQQSSISNLCIDIQNFQLKTVAELTYHWKKIRNYKMFFLNPILGRNIQIAVFLMGIFVASFLIVYYRMQYIQQLDIINNMLSNLYEEKENYYKLLESYNSFRNLSVFKISDYMKPNSNFFAFWFSWFFCLYHTFHYMFDKEYNFFIIVYSY